VCVCVCSRAAAVVVAVRQKRRTKDGAPTLSIMEVVCQQQWLHYCPNTPPDSTSTHALP